MGCEGVVFIAVHFVPVRWNLLGCRRHMPVSGAQGAGQSWCAPHPRDHHTLKETLQGPSGQPVQMLVSKCHDKYFLVFQSDSEVVEAEILKAKWNCFCIMVFSKVVPQSRHLESLIWHALMDRRERRVANSAEQGALPSSASWS